MNPQDIQNQEQLDPTIVNLAKAIGKAESGGKYNAPSGDKGSSPSAYQFTPGFIGKWGPQVLGDTYQHGQSLSPEQQDKLAYGVIKTMGTTGDPGYSHLGKLSPAEIASAWSAGDPHAYLDPEYGKNNAYGSVSKYVDVVKKNYEDLNQPTPKTGISEFDKNVTLPVAAGGGILAGLGGLAVAGEGALGSIWEGAKGLAGNAVKGLIGGTVADIVGKKEDIIQAPKTSDFASQLLNQSMPQQNQASKTISDVINETMNKTPSGRTLMQDPNMQNATETMGRYGFAPEVSDGALDFQTGYKKSRTTIDQLETGVQKLLKDEQSPLQQAVDSAKRNIREFAPSNEWADADKAIEEEADTYRKNFTDKNGNISNANLERMKKEMWHGQKFNVQDTNAKKVARKALGFGARMTIASNTQHKDFYNSAMKEEQQIINAQKIMKRLNGKKSPEHYSVSKSLLHSGGRYVALYIGDKIGGPMGAVLGDMVGRYIVGTVDRAKGKTIFETPQVRKAIEEIKKDHPEYYGLLIKELEKHGVNVVGKGGLLGLPAPATKLGPRTGVNESVVVGGKTPPLSVEQAKKRKAGRSEGGLYGHLTRIKEAQKAAGLQRR